jgi:threonyl-tRNA synthetase
VRVLPITENQIGYARDIVKELRDAFVRADLEFSNDKLQGRILRAEEAKVHTMLIVGQKEQDAHAVAVRIHGKGNVGVKPRVETVADLLQAIHERRS